MTNERDIEMRCGKNNRFSVPEGYFETLTARVMENIPEEQSNVIELKRSKFSKWTIAACAAAACFVGVFMFNDNTTTSQNTNAELTASTQKAVYDEEYQKEVLEYAMLNENDVYNYLAGVEY